MAKAKVIQPEKPSIQLDLTGEEAEILLFVTRRIGGAPGLSPRGKMDSIGTALRAVGVAVTVFKTNDRCNSIYFE